MLSYNYKIIENRYGDKMKFIKKNRKLFLGIIIGLIVSGTVVYATGYAYAGSTFSVYSNSYAVRPVITLKSGLTTASGSGTSTSHYTLSAS
jgi:hypothetical protein